MEENDQQNKNSELTDDPNDNDQDLFESIFDKVRENTKVNDDDDLEEEEEEEEEEDREEENKEEKEFINLVNISYKKTSDLPGSLLTQVHNTHNTADTTQKHIQTEASSRAC